MKDFKINTILILIIVVLTSCLKEDELNLPFNSFEPQEINDGIITSHPSAENIDSIALVKIYENITVDENFWTLKSMLILRNGKLIAENYFKDKNDITNKDLVWSCTKQFVGVLTGIAIDEGMIESIDDPVSKYMPEEFANHPDKANITIKNMLTMQSGIDYNNDGSSGQTDKLLRQIPDNMTDFILDRPLIIEQGTKFHYNDGNPNLISAMLQKLAKKPTDEWADEVLFSKIGFKNYTWSRYKDGITLGGFGIKTTPRELAKLSIMVANNGEYNNEQIVSSDWITEMTAQKANVENSDYAFGYFWWINTEKNIVQMWGVGGQFVFIVPDKNLIIITTGLPNIQDENQLNIDNTLEYVERIVNISY
jgi:CubicO group peptidase (beta-lactamase class C family)